MKGYPPLPEPHALVPVGKLGNQKAMPRFTPEQMYQFVDADRIYRAGEACADAGISDATLAAAAQKGFDGYWTEDCSGVGLEAWAASAKAVFALNPPPKLWRCFHCGEVFTEETEAALHFGTRMFQQPACQIDVAKYREMEELHRRHCEEDTDQHREIYALQSKHQTELLREEEKGYARGLKDGPFALTDAMVESVCMALLGKQKDPAPQVNWWASRQWRVNTLREKMRKALQKALDEAKEAPNASA